MAPSFSSTGRPSSSGGGPRFAASEVSRREYYLYMQVMRRSTFDRNLKPLAAQGLVGADAGDRRIRAGLVAAKGRVERASREARSGSLRCYRLARPPLSSGVIRRAAT